MAAPNYEQVQSFAGVQKQLADAAKEEFLEYIYDGISIEEVYEAAANVAAKFRLLGAELGAQWYDLCTSLAGVDVPSADIAPYDLENARESVRSAAKAIPQGQSVQEFFGDFVSNQVAKSVRDTGSSNLWRDYYRGVRGGKWARVPVGETCAWCYMLASNGAWYVSEESALGKEADHYHRGCNCVAVYYSDAEQIGGYGGALAEYKDMYYTVENMREANAKGREPYPEELEQRIASAKAEHIQRENDKEREAMERGEEYKKKPWTVYNEDMILMRDVYGLK